MYNLIKKLINGPLSLINLQVNRIHSDTITGSSLFDDLKVILGKKSPVCIDVGANEGQTIDHLLSRFPQCYIHSFEPSKDTFKILKEKTYGDRVYLNNYALGRHRQRREFINYESSDLSSFLHMDANAENRFRDIAEKKREMVDIETLDHYLDQHKIENIDLLKIDTQGFDLEVLLGAEKSLQNGIINNVLIELNFIPIYEGQSSSSDVSALLENNGFYLIDYYEKYRHEHTLAWCTALYGRR